MAGSNGKKSVKMADTGYPDKTALNKRPLSRSIWRQDEENMLCRFEYSIM